MQKRTTYTQTIQFYNTKNKYTQTNTIENIEEDIKTDIETTDKIVTPNKKFTQPNSFNWHEEAKYTQTKITTQNRTTQTPRLNNWNRRLINKRKRKNEDKTTTKKVKNDKCVMTNREDIEIESENLEKWLEIVARK